MSSKEKKDEFLEKYLNKVEHVCIKKSLWGYPTNFYEYDKFTNGLHNSELTVIAARHSMGKTSFVLNLAVNLAEQSIPTLLISYDLSEEALTDRLISSIAEIDSNVIKSGNIREKDWEKISVACEKLSNLTANNFLNLVPDCYLNYKDLFEKIREFKTEYDKGVVIIDYFQLIKLYRPEDTRIIELSSLAASFKHLAMEITMPIVLVSQVSKKCEERNDKRPILSDLAECDALAQHSDNLIFIYREDYYSRNDDYECIPTRNIAEIIIAKQKNGRIGNFELLFQAPIHKFKNKIKPEIL